MKGRQVAQEMWETNAVLEQLGTACCRKTERGVVKAPAHGGVSNRTTMITDYPTVQGFGSSKTLIKTKCELMGGWVVLGC